MRFPTRTFFPDVAFTTIVLLLLGGSCQAQIERLLAWQRDLAAISSDPEPRLADVRAIREEAEEWIALHPESGAKMPQAPPQPWTEEQLREQLGVLKTILENLERNDSSHPFSLGATVVNVTASSSALSPVADSMDQSEIRSRDALTVKDAIRYLPGVSVDDKAPRNQSGISIGGFDSRQAPLYLDGIPLYVPFDGYVDLARYLTSDIAEVQVAKGYSSPLLGPNLLGGVINLVTREPRKKLEADALIGGGSGNLLNSGLHLGSRWRRFYFQGAIDWLQSDFFPLSGNFPANTQQPNHRRLNSYQRDERFSGRAAWTPREGDSYVFSYNNQKGNFGDPPYSGTAPACPSGNAAVSYPCVTPKYWAWPFWNTNSYYFSSSTHVGELGLIKVRAFYNHYPNSLEMFDDATYSTQYKNASSGALNYNDHSIGSSGEFDTRLFQRHTIGMSFFIKDDRHREETTTFSAKNIPSTTPWQQDRDQQSSFGAQDTITISSRIRATLGFSADHLNGVEAQDLSSNKLQVVPLQVSGTCTAVSATTFASCTDHVWAYNPAATVSYAAGKAGVLFATFAEKSRFPTLKDRYSYKLGKAIPDPELRPEHAQNWTIGYSRAFGRTTMAQVDFFRSSVRNEIENISFLSPLCTGGGKGAGCQHAVNVGRELHEGINVTVRSTPLSRLTLDANYSYLNRNITGTPGIFPFGTPKHKTVGSAVVRMPRGAMGILSMRYESGMTGMSDNGLPLPVSKFATADMGGMVPIKQGLTLQAGVKNLLDRNYYLWEGFPEEGRNWYLTARYRF